MVQSHAVTSRPAIGRSQDKHTVVPCAEKWSDCERLDMSTGDHAHHLDSSVTTMMNRLIGESLEVRYVTRC